VCCSVLQRVVYHTAETTSSPMLLNVWQSKALQHTATRCNTLQYTATHSNKPELQSRARARLDCHRVETWNCLARWNYHCPPLFRPSNARHPAKVAHPHKWNNHSHSTSAEDAWTADFLYICIKYTYIYIFVFYMHIFAYIHVEPPFTFDFSRGCVDCRCPVYVYYIYIHIYLSCTYTYIYT